MSVLWLESPSSLPSGDFWLWASLLLLLSANSLCSDSEDLTGIVWLFMPLRPFYRNTKKTMKNNLVSLHFSAYCKWKITIRTFFYYGLLFKSVFFFSEKSVAIIFSKNTSHLRSRRKLIIRNSLFFDVIFFSPPKIVKIFDFFSPHIFNVCCLQSGSFHGQGNVVHLWEDLILLGK